LHIGRLRLFRHSFLPRFAGLKRRV
jgi:hypothetical protein